MKPSELVCIRPARKLILELTSRCNLHCQMCITHGGSAKDNSHKFEDTEEKIIQKVLPLIENIEELELGGTGEPLISKDFVKNISLFRKTNPLLKIILFTNGTMLKDKTTREAVLKNIHYLQISINGVQKNYEENMFGSSWSNIQDVLSLIKQERKKPWTAFGYIVMKNNWKSLFKLLFIAKKFEIREIALKDLWVSTPKLKQQSIRESAVLEFFVFIIISLLHLIAWPLGIKITTSDLPFRSKITKQKTCTAPWNQMQINSNGEVLLCCNGRTVIGNLYTHSLERIWNSGKAINYRKGLLSKKYYKECKTCKLLNGRSSKTLKKDY